MKKVHRKLAATRGRYTSLEEMAEALRRHPGFEGLNRATISRWLRRPTQRAVVAVEILNSLRHRTRLRLGEPQALSGIPSAMLSWELEEGKPYGLLEKQYGVLAQVRKSESGGDRLEQLLKGRVEIAILPGDLLNQLGPYCHRVCSLTKLYVCGIAINPVESVSDLKGKTLGALAGSTFGLRLQELGRNWGLTLSPPLGLPSPKDCAQALLSGRIAGMIGSEPSVSYVRRAVERSMTLFPFPRGMLGWFEMHVVVNLKIAYPANVRAYLCALRETTRYANARKSVTAFHTEIASRYHLDQGDVRDVLANTTFSLGDFDPETVLTLWEREVVRLRKT